MAILVLFSWLEMQLLGFNPCFNMFNTVTSCIICKLFSNVLQYIIYIDSCVTQEGKDVLGHLFSKTKTDVQLNLGQTNWYCTAKIPTRLASICFRLAKLELQNILRTTARLLVAGNLFGWHTSELWQSSLECHLLFNLSPSCLYTSDNHGNPCRVIPVLFWKLSNLYIM